MGNSNRIFDHMGDFHSGNLDDALDKFRKSVEKKYGVNVTDDDMDVKPFTEVMKGIGQRMRDRSLTVDDILTFKAFVGSVMPIAMAYAPGATADAIDNIIEGLSDSGIDISQAVVVKNKKGGE